MSARAATACVDIRDLLKAAVAELAATARGYKRGSIWHQLRERQGAA